jgi:hypothetical protein
MSVFKDVRHGDALTGPAVRDTERPDPTSPPGSLHSNDCLATTARRAALKAVNREAKEENLLTRSR